jgi:hypothetical protein
MPSSESLPSLQGHSFPSNGVRLIGIRFFSRWIEQSIDSRRGKQNKRTTDFKMIRLTRNWKTNFLLNKDRWQIVHDMLEHKG